MFQFKFYICNYCQLWFFTHLQLCLATANHNLKIVVRGSETQLQVGKKLNSI